MPRKTKPLDDYIEKYPQGCWLWRGTLLNSGYGIYKINSTPQLAHRVVYEKYKKKIAPGLQLDHLCRTRHCVNPDHLEEVSGKINSQRGKQAKLTPQDVKQIKDLFRYTTYLQREIAEMYGVTQPTISEVINRRIWS